MGECNFYAKIYFKDNHEAATAVGKVQNFFMECLNAYEWWINNNGDYKFKQDNSLPEAFKVKFPQAAKYLDTTSNQKESICIFDDIGSEEEIRNIDAEENYIYHTALAWHFADWENILMFVVSECNAVRSAWTTDEDVDYFELI